MEFLSGGREPSFEKKHYIEGIGRRKVGKNFEYYYIRNNQLVSKKDLIRIKNLKIPPAWNNVWISSDPNTAIQAIGYDSKGRKQYRYHQKHIEEASKKKFLRMFHFIKSIPKLEKAMKEHENLGPYTKERVIVSMLTIIRELHMRIGKEVYARKNKSYGVASLRKIHMKFDGDVIKFRFKGKSRKRLFYSLYNPKLKEHLKLLLKLEGPRLFQYIDENNKVKPITDVDLNRYIQTYLGKQFIIKDFRTYSSNYFFVKSLLNETKKRIPNNKKNIKKNILKAINKTSYYLRHSKAISKKSYILNFIIELYQQNPEYFINKKKEDPDTVLLDILKLYKKKILNE